MATGTFATAFNCIDGRAQSPVADWVKINTQAEYVDMITEPGADLVLASGSPELIEALKQKALVSVNAHNSGVIVVAGHDECAANPVSAEEHAQHIRAAMQTIASWNLPVRVAGLWVNSWGYVEVVGTL